MRGVMVRDKPTFQWQMVIIICIGLLSSLDVCAVKRDDLISITEGENQYMDESANFHKDEVILGKGNHSLEHKEFKTCTPCRTSIERVHNIVGDTERQIMIVKILHGVCEVTETYVNECKRMIFMYGPLLLGNVQKVLSDNDVCYLMCMCKDPLPQPSPPPPEDGKYATMYSGI